MSEPRGQSPRAGRGPRRRGRGPRPRCCGPDVEDLVQLENAVREVTIRDVAASTSRIAAELADEYEQQNGRSARHADPVRL